MAEISMFTRLKNAVVALTSSDSANAGNVGSSANHRSNINRSRRTTVNKKCVSQHGPESCFDLPYNRPHFLSLNIEEIQASADKDSRPIILPKNISKLPWNSGYAEVINSGKSAQNEDQARAEVFSLNMSSEQTTTNEIQQELHSFAAVSNNQVTYFAIFDGHAGVGAALMAANNLHSLIKENLLSVNDSLTVKKASESSCHTDDNRNVCGCFCHQNQIPADKSFRIGNIDIASQIEADDLIIGALERAFVDMDSKIGKVRKFVSSGCTALAVVFFMGKLYVANAGDSRAVICKDGKGISASFDFTPDSEKRRIHMLAYMQPALIDSEFTHVEYTRVPMRQDIGKKVHYRDAWMTGWSMKTATEEDVRKSVVLGRGKVAKILSTIGVSRGFGDHDLMLCNSNIKLKPFLLAVPDVKVFNMCSSNYSEDDVLILATDGLWDIIRNDDAAQIVQKSLAAVANDNPKRYALAAQDLLMKARGSDQESWISGDDITVFIIPLHNYSSSFTTLNQSD